MIRLRPAALLLLAALPGAARAACNPVGTENCCTKIVDEVCDEVQWPSPETITPLKLQNGGARFDLVGLTTDCRYRGYRLESWIANNSGTVCPADRKIPYYDTVQSVVTWKISKNGTTLSSGIGMSATCLEAVNGDVKCKFTVRSYAGVCLDHTDVFETTVCFDEHPAPLLSLKTPTVIPRYSTDPAERPVESCSLSLDRAYSIPVTVQLSCSRVRFEENQSQALSHTFSPGETSFTFAISGLVPSDKTDDGEIVATVQTDLGGYSVTNAVTVVWVDLSLLTYGPYPEDYDFENSPESKVLGSIQRIELPGYRTTIGNMVLIVGEVKPADFPVSLVFQRDIVGQYYEQTVGWTTVLGPENSSSIPRGSDEAFDPIYITQADFLPPPNGHIYDLDIPGLAYDDIATGLENKTYHEGDVFLARYNFAEFVDSVFGRCSNDFYWYSRTSVVIDHSFREDGIDFRFDASNDNEVGVGQTTLSP